MQTQTINFEEKFTKFDELWTPHVVAEANGQHVRITKLKGEYVWHSHDNEDELFIVLKGTLVVKFRDGERRVGPGEMLVIPRGVEHKPTADELVHLVNITKKETTTTGATETDMRVELEDLKWV